MGLQYRIHTVEKIKVLQGIGLCAKNNGPLNRKTSCRSVLIGALRLLFSQGIGFFAKHKRPTEKVN